jgi:hypothetical protein
VSLGYASIVYKLTIFLALAVRLVVRLCVHLAQAHHFPRPCCTSRRQAMRPSRTSSPFSSPVLYVSSSGYASISHKLTISLVCAVFHVSGLCVHLSQARLICRPCLRIVARLCVHLLKAYEFFRLCYAMLCVKGCERISTSLQALHGR